MPRKTLLLLVILLSPLVGCFGSGTTPANAPGTGRAKFFLELVEWGRLVDVFDQNGVLVNSDILVRETLTDVSGSYTFSLNPLTQTEFLTIHEDASSLEFQILFASATTGLVALATKGMEDPGPFTRVARNGAIRLQFSEWVDPASVMRETLQVALGDPVTSLQAVRYIVSNDEVGTDGLPKGVIIIDPTISPLEEAQLGIPQNGVGLPESTDSLLANLSIRIPTVVDPLLGQTMILTNLSGNRGLEPTSGDPLGFSLNLDPVVVRAFRSGNSTDPYNGFMTDIQKPKLFTDMDVDVLNISQSAGTGLSTLTYRIRERGCRDISPKVGDVFQVGNGLLLVTKVEDASQSSAYVVSGAILANASSFPSGDYSSAPLGGLVSTVYESQDAPLQLCWVRFSPEPSGGLPARGVDPMATLTLTFNEPIDDSTVKSLESMMLVSYVVNPSMPSGDPPSAEHDLYAARQFDPASELVGDYIDRQLGYQLSGTGSGRVQLGPVAVSADSRAFTLAPSAGISDTHLEGTAQRLALALRDGGDGLLDLAGNPVAFDSFVAGNEGQAELITLQPAVGASVPTERYFALRFNSTDENNDGLTEYVGQFVFDAIGEPGILRGRSVNRFSRQADISNAFIAQRIQFSQGIMTPLTPAGAVLMTCWPYHMLGFGLLVSSEINVDVEGMAWSPFGGSAFDYIFQKYSLALSHSERTPDDEINISSGYPKYPNSGLQRNNKPFDENILGFPTYNELIVNEGVYQISGGDVFEAASGTKMLPWNDFDSTYTWRDNDIPQYDDLDRIGFLGGRAGGCLPPATTGQACIWTALNHRSIGVPLLARFRCWPEGSEFGNNGLQIQIMVGSSAQPAFRVFSAGGRTAGGQWKMVIPDDPSAGGTVPQGGYNTNTGFTTKNHGPELYWQNVDFVVRISRVFTHWFYFGGVLNSVSAITSEPLPANQPTGTQVILEFRGTADIDPSPCFGSLGFSSSILDNAALLDLYGDEDMDPITNGGCAVLATPTGWTTDLNTLLTHPSGIDFQYFQIRMTFVGNIDQDLNPELDALGFAWNVL